MQSRRVVRMWLHRSEAALLLLMMGCGPALPSGTTASTFVAKNVIVNEGVVVTSACTPTGAELCFNANDDNCNGVIDEGCGVGTGVLQFMVAWGDSPADIDLSVLDPNGKRVQKSNRSNEGLSLEKNCPDDGCHGQNVENIFFDGAEPPHGRYVVDVKLVDPRGAELPVRARFSARVGSRIYAMDLRLSPEGGQDNQAFRFDL